MQKVAAEVRANNVVADVIEGTGVGEEAVGANVVQPYYSPPVLRPIRRHTAIPTNCGRRRG